MMKLGLLGSTGSIGRQTLDVVRSSEDIRVAALAVMKNIEPFWSRSGNFILRSAVFTMRKRPQNCGRDCKQKYLLMGIMGRRSSPAWMD